MLFSREPVMVAAAVRAIILAAVSFGLELTPEQIASLMLAVEAVLAVITRQTVTAPATLREAGTSKAEILAAVETKRGQ